MGVCARMCPSTASTAGWDWVHRGVRWALQTRGAGPQAPFLLGHRLSLAGGLLGDGPWGRGLPKSYMRTEKSRGVGKGAQN